MTNTKSDQIAKVFLKRLLLCFAVISLSIFVWKRSDLFPWIGTCNPAGYEGGSFLAYCHSSRFGDLEHSVFWQDMEPSLMQNVQNAEILFLGNSRTQYAFSTTAVSDFFAKKSYKHYVFGFGMGSQNSVPEMLNEKYPLSPKAVIINTDPFFTDRISGTNQAMLEDNWERRWELKAKRWLAQRQEKTCMQEEPGYLKSLLCNGTEETLYRRINDGHWDVRYFRKVKHIPTAIDDQQNLGVSLEESIQIAERFIKELGVKKQCVIFTVTPRTQTPLGFSKKLATALEVTAIYPELGELFTIDDSHLDPESAMRWSAAILAEAEPILDLCTKN